MTAAIAAGYCPRCQSAVLWAETTDGELPVNVDQHPAGTVTVGSRQYMTPRAKSLTGADLVAPTNAGKYLYVEDWSTCPMGGSPEPSRRRTCAAGNGGAVRATPLRLGSPW